MTENKKVLRFARKSREYSHAVSVILVVSLVLGFFLAIDIAVIVEGMTRPAPVAHDYSADTDDFMVAAAMQRMEDRRVEREREERASALSFAWFLGMILAGSIIVVCLVQGNKISEFRKHPEAYRFYKAGLSKAEVTEEGWGRNRRAVFTAMAGFTAENGRKVKKQVKRGLGIFETIEVEEVVKIPITVFYNLETDVMLTYSPGVLPETEEQTGPFFSLSYAGRKSERKK